MKFFRGLTLHTNINDRLAALTLSIVRISECTDRSFFLRVFRVISANHSGIEHVFCDESACFRIIPIAEFVEFNPLPVFNDSVSQSALLVANISGSGADDFFTILLFYKSAFFERGVVDITFELCG